ncbi:sphingomyelin phosphodiesterase, partial [Bacillus thuringiensis]
YTGHTATWDATTNSIAKYNFPDSPAEYLDYIIASKDHANPSYIENKVLQPKSPQWTVTSWFQKYTYNDYSDHCELHNINLLKGVGHELVTKMINLVP